MKNDQTLLNQKSLVDSFLSQGPRPLASFSFINVFAWTDFFDFEFNVINGSLCIFAHHDSGCFLYLPPLGKRFDPSTIELAFKHMAPEGKLSAVNRIENIPGNLLSAFGPSSYNQYRKPAEYLYRKEELIALQGNAYKSKRHDCNIFMTQVKDYSFETYKDADFDGCMALFDVWAADRAKNNTNEIYRAMLQENRLVHARLLRWWQPLGIVAKVLKTQGKIIGYTFGFPIDETTCCVYAEIADLNIPGTAAYLFKSFCAESQLKDYSWINTMDDFAMPNVARAKEAYHPAALTPSYSVTIKKRTS